MTAFVEDMTEKIKREALEFTRKGNSPFTQDDIRMAVFIRERIEMCTAELDALHKGLISFEIPDPSDLKSAFVMLGKNAGAQYGS